MTKINPKPTFTSSAALVSADALRVGGAQHCRPQFFSTKGNDDHDQNNG